MRHSLTLFERGVRDLPLLPPGQISEDPQAEELRSQVGRVPGHSRSYRTAIAFSLLPLLDVAAVAVLLILEM
jgi:hypothetical protein